MKKQSPQISLRPQLAWILVIVATFGFVSAFISLQAGAFALIFAALAWFVWKYPEEGFLLLLVVMPILPMLKITQTIGTFSLLKDVIILTLFLRLWCIPVLQRRLPYRRNIILAPFVLIGLWAAFAGLRAQSLVFGAVLFRDVALYMMAFLAVLYLPKHSQEIMRKRFQWFFATVGVTLALGVWQWFFAQDSAVLRFDPVARIWIPRISSVLAHPSIYGEYLVAALVILGAIFFTAQKKVQRLWSLGGMAVLLAFIVLTYSRGVWLATAAAGCVMAAAFVWNSIRTTTSRKKLGVYVVSGIAVAGVVLTVVATITPVGGLLRSIVDPTYASNEERVTFLVRLVAPLSNTDALIGVGLGNVSQQNFRSVALDAFDVASAASRTVQLAKDKTLVDNQHLKTFIEMGFVGVLLYFWMYARLIRHALSASKSTDVLDRMIGLAALGFFTAFILQGFLIDIWNIFPTNLLFWIFAAYISEKS